MRAASFVGIALASFFGAMVACGSFGEGTPEEGSPDATNGSTDSGSGGQVDGAADSDAKVDGGGSFCEDAGIAAACEDFDPPIEGKGFALVQNGGGFAPAADPFVSPPGSGRAFLPASPNATPRTVALKAALLVDAKFHLEAKLLVARLDPVDTAEMTVARLAIMSTSAIPIVIEVIAGGADARISSCFATSCMGRVVEGLGSFNAVSIDYVSATGKVDVAVGGASFTNSNPPVTPQSAEVSIGAVDVGASTGNRVVAIDDALANSSK